MSSNDSKNIAIGFGFGALTAGIFFLLNQRRVNSHEEASEEHKIHHGETRKILVCGSGMMTPSLVDFLMETHENSITIASNIVEDATNIAKKHPGRCKACYLDVSDFETTVELIREHEIVISYIPPFLHPKIFKACAEAKVNLVTASYISEDMLTYDKHAKEHGLIFLNECGLDPGIDIMSTMKVKDEVEGDGGKIIKYESWCGGLPAAEDSDNPLSYKFSWDPKAVFNTSKNSATFLKNDKMINIEPEELLNDGTRDKKYSKALNLEGYPNRDSMVFKEAFDFKHAKTFVRGTLRYKGFKIIMRALHQIGITDSSTQIDHDKIKSFRDLSESLVQGLGPAVDDYEEDFKNASITDEQDKKLYSRLLEKVPDKENVVEIIQSWKFFELLNSHREVKEEWKTPLDALSAISLEKMSYKEGERDLVVMKHIFGIETKDGEEKTLHSTMIASGDRVGSDGYSIMAKSVGYTTGIAVNLILDGKIKSTGVLSPKTPEFYDQILPQLEEHGIKVLEEFV